MGDRAPVGIFNIPDKPGDIMENIDMKYQTWYRVWNESFLPLILNRQKWHEKSENLVPGDIVYFKLTESKMSANWRTGKVENVKIGADGCVRTVSISYKDTSAENPEDWTHRTVDRPVRNLVKIFHIDETLFMEDLDNCHKLVENMLKEADVKGADLPMNNDKKASMKNTNSDENQLDTNTKFDVEEENLEDESDDDDKKESIPKPQARKKRSMELENLEINKLG